MPTSTLFTPQNLADKTLHEAGKKELYELADQYPYFLPLKVIRGLLENETQALRELPYYYEVNPVVLHYLAAKLKQQPGAAKSSAIVGWAAAATEKKAASNDISNTVAAPAEEKTAVPETIIGTELPEPSVPEIQPEEAVVNPSETTEAPVASPEKSPEAVAEPLPETIAEAAEPALPQPTEMEAIADAASAEQLSVQAAENIIEVESQETKTKEDSGKPAPEGRPDILPVEATPETPEDPMIQPLFTKDYFKHQGVSMETGENTFDLRKPSGNDLMVMRSFGEWLRFFHAKKAKDDEEQEDKRALKAMWQKGKLAAALEEEDEEIPEVVFEMAVKSISHEGNPATETMAKIYLAQGKWEKAIGVYEQLQLRNPQKSTYFAEKIAAIEQQHRP